MGHVQVLPPPPKLYKTNNQQSDSKNHDTLTSESEGQHVHESHTLH